MPFLFIGSTGNNGGQSLFTWAIARILRQKGFSVGFFKPFGSDPTKIDDEWVDRDAFLFRDFLHLTAPLKSLCPYPFQEELDEDPEKILDQIENSAHELSAGNDLTLVMGREQIFFDKSLNNWTDISIVKRLKADFILLNRYHGFSNSLYSILSVCSMVEKINGILINRVPEDEMDDVKGKMAPLLKAKGLPLTAIIPEKANLSLISLEEVRSRLGGEIISGEERLAGSVSGITVGSADLSGELRIFKRVYNKIILLGPADKTATGAPSSRPVIAIVITGGLKPPEKIFDLAKKNAIPLLFVKNDTFAAIDLIQKGSSSLSTKDESKLNYFTTLLDQAGAFESLFETLTSG